MKLTYKDIPEDVRDFLYGPEVSLAYDEIVEKNQLPTGSDAMLVSAVEAVLHDDSSLENLPSYLQAKGLSEKQAKNVAVELAGRVFLPVTKAFGDVAGQIRSWGREPGGFTSGSTQHTGSLTAEKFVSSTLSNKGIHHPDPNLEHRLEIALIAYVKGVRDQAETLQLLMRASKVGGLALEEAIASNFIKEIDNAKGFVDIVTEEPIAAEIGAPKPTPVQPNPPAPKPPAPPPAPKPAPAPAAKPVIKPAPPAPSRVVPPKFDEPEEAPAPAAARPVTPPPTPAQPVAMQGRQSPEGDLGVAIDQFVAESGVTLSSDDLNKRFRSIVESRLREVRNAFETRALLEASTDANGIGLRGRQLADTVEKLEAATDRYSASMAGARKQEKDDAMRRKREAEEERRRTVAQREEELLSKRYETITGKSAVAAPAPAKPLPPPSKQVEQVKQAVVAAQKQPVRTPPAVRPKVTDVTFSRTLSGPVEELRTMDLTDFRRLSKKPEEAALKIKDKIDLLEEQGYEKRIAAVKAWRTSPINQLYLLLSQEALMNGKGISAVLEERRSNGVETLREDELRAIMTLNSQLRF